MKYIMNIIVMFLVSIFIVIISNPFLLETRNPQQNNIIAQILEADKVKFTIKYQFDTKKIIGHKDGVDVAAVIGKYSTIDDIMSIMGKFYSVEAALIEIKKIGLCAIGNKIGAIMADGEESYIIDDKSIFEFVGDNEVIKFVKITMIGDVTKKKGVFYYKLELIGNRWIITDEAREEDVYSAKNGWVIIRSSSCLSGKNIPYRRYCAGNAYDSDPSTAWVEGKPDDGIGEWIDFSFYQSMTINTIRIINGYAKKQDIYQVNNRVKRLRIFLDGNFSFESDLKDHQIDYQLFNLPEKQNIKRIRLVILEIYPGTKYHDTCVSEVDFQ